MSSTTKRKKKASEKTLPSYPAPSLPDLLIQYDDWVDAARVFGRELMQQLYTPLVCGTSAFIHTLDPANPLVVELQAAYELVWYMKDELARRSHEFLFPRSRPCYRPCFDDPQVIEQLAIRIARIRRLSKDDQNVHDVPEGYRLGKEAVDLDSLPIPITTIRSWAENDRESSIKCAGGPAWRIEWLDKRIDNYKRRPKQ